MRTHSQIHAVVIGGGIGGLFAANALIAQGVRVSLYEQADALREVGAGLLLTPNSVRQLRRLGLAARIEREGAKVGPGSGYFRHDGTLVAPYQVADPTDGIVAFGVHRADLVEALADALPHGVLHTGHRCTAFEQDGSVARVRFANGAEAAGDVVVAADGIHSGLRRHVASPAPPVYSGAIVYRGLVPRERIPHWPAAAWLMWIGEGRHILAYPTRRDTLINYGGFVPAPEPTIESWSAPGDPAALRAAFARWDPRIATLLAQVDATLRWALYDREALACWTRGRLTLLGDAAHPMLPHGGQGANQSIEDGMALATILARADRETISGALLAYERIRCERVTAIQSHARQNGRRYASASAEPAARDAEIAAQAEFRRRLYAHDVVAEAQAAAAALPGMYVAGSEAGRAGRATDEPERVSR